MKLRILGNSLRLRLTRGEVERVCAGEWVEQSTRFGPEPAPAFTYRIGPAESSAESRAGSQAAHATLEAAQISVFLPSSFLADWAASNTVGIEAKQPIGDEQELRILVEKDFKCLAPRDDEDQSDAFANPLESH